MNKRIVAICVGLLLLGSMAVSVDAYTVEVGFFFDGLDLDLGTEEYDRTILLVVMGDTIEELLRPDREPLADFSPPVDISFGFDPAEDQYVDLILQENVQIALLEGMTIDEVDPANWSLIGTLDFSLQAFTFTLGENESIVAWTPEDRYFAIGNVQRIDEWAISAEIIEIVPEPSTFVLVGLGLAGIFGLLRRKKKLVAMFIIVALTGFLSAQPVSAQISPDQITVTKEGSGNGSILVGEYTCDPACVEMSVPYVDGRSLLFKVLPDEDSYFMRWKKADNKSYRGTVHVGAGDTVSAVFGKKWVPFDPADPAESPAPPEIQVPVSNLQEVVVDFNFPGMHVGIIEQEEEVYQRLEISGSGYTTAIGQPQVPALGRFIALPAGANVEVEILESAFQELEEYMVYPAQEPPSDAEGASIPPFTINSNFYQQDAFYPSTPVELEGPFIIRGSSVVILRVFPVQFNPVQRVIRVYSKLRMRLNFDDGEDYFIEDRVRNSSFDNMFKALLLNSDTAVQDDSGTNSSSRHDSSLLIITDPQFHDAAKKLAEWKIKKGIFTEIRTTTQTGNTATGIQTFIQNAYDNWDPSPTDILLIGDAEFIPCHYRTWHPSNLKATCNGCQGDIGTDLYYATVDGSDFLPDLHLGRLSVDTRDEANTRVENIINYEKNPPSSDSDFYNQAVVAAYFQDRSPVDGFEDLRYVLTAENVRNYLSSSGYNVGRIYYTGNTIIPTNWGTSYWPGTGDPIPTVLQKPAFPWNGDNTAITNAINDGRFLVFHRDHGSKLRWGFPEYKTTDVLGLGNGNELPVVWSINCETGWFDNETDNPNPDHTATNDIHFSETWERNSNGGAVGMIAATRRSQSGYNDRLAWGLMDAMWPNFDPLVNSSTVQTWEMGSILNNAKLYMANFYALNNTYTKIGFELYHWFGDPTMQIWTKAPQKLNVSHLSSLPKNAESLTVHVSQRDALICVSRDGTILGKAHSNGGETSIELSKPLSEGDTLYVVVTKHNFRPYEGTISVGVDTIVLYDAGDTTSSSTATSHALCANSPNRPGGYSKTLPLALDGLDTFFPHYGVPQGVPVTGPSGVKIADSWVDLMDGSIDTSLQDAEVLPPMTYWWSSDECGLPCNCQPGLPPNDNVFCFGMLGNSWDTTSNWIQASDSLEIPGRHKALCLAYNPDPEILSGGCQVSNNLDDGPGSLRQFLTDAWSNECSTISFAPDISTTILTNSPINILIGDLTIEGGGVAIGSKSSPVFQVGSEANVTIHDLRVYKGGIINAGQLSLQGNTRIQGNTEGSGITNYRGSITIGKDVKISDNSTGIDNKCGTVLVDGTVISNAGTGISSMGGTVTLNGAVKGNKDGGINLSCSTLTVNGTICWNQADTGGGINAFQSGVSGATNATVYGNTANTCDNYYKSWISQDPLTHQPDFYDLCILD